MTEGSQTTSEVQNTLSELAARKPQTPEERSYFLQDLAALMEEMANAPKEEYGKRQPGERCMYEIQRKEKWDLEQKRTSENERRTGIHSVTS